MPCFDSSIVNNNCIASDYAGWSFLCHTLLEAIALHVTSLTYQIAQADENGDRESSTTLRHSSIVSLTTVAELYHVMGTKSSSPLNETYQKKCDEALWNIVKVTQKLKPEDFAFLDSILSVCPNLRQVQLYSNTPLQICWSRAISLFVDDRLPPVEQSAAPRRAFNNDRLDASILILNQAKEKLEISIQLNPGGAGLLCNKLGDAIGKDKREDFDTEVRRAHGF